MQDTNTVEVRHKALAVIMPDGSMVSMGCDGSRELFLMNLKSVGIRNLSEIETYNINAIANSISHYVKFAGGGELWFAYGCTGQLIDLNWKQLDWILGPGNELAFFVPRTN